MGRSSPIGVLACLLGACGGGAPSQALGERIADVRFDTLGGEVWAFEHRVSGRAPEGCVAVEVKRGPVRLRAPVRRGRFGVTVPLAPGENVVGAYCVDPAVRAREARLVYRVRLPAGPRAILRLGVSADHIELDGVESTPNRGTHLPLTDYRWSADPSNPAPLRSADGRSLRELAGPRASLAVPSDDGEYLVWLTATDAAGRDDCAGVSFRVEGGRARRIDPMREHPAWLDRAVVCGPIGEAAFDTISARLPRLAELGVDALRLSPLSDSPGGDRGDTEEFGVRVSAGRLQAFRALVGRAHALGIRILLDFAPSHTSEAHRYSLSAARDGRRSPYWRFYTRGSGEGAARGPETLLRLDHDEPEVRRWIIEALSLWARALDVDGFVVNGGWNVAERAPGFFAALRRELARIEPRVALLAEARVGTRTYLDDGFDPNRRPDRGRSVGRRVGGG